MSKHNSGTKADVGKAPYHLIAPELLAGVAKVLAFGASKYDERNWERGMEWSRVFSALQRHIWAWHEGEEADPETGFSHLDHVACNIMFLMAYEKRGLGIDNRPVSPFFDYDGAASEDSDQAEDLDAYKNYNETFGQSNPMPEAIVRLDKRGAILV